MARLVSAPKISKYAMGVRNPAKPAARASISRREPYQLASPRTALRIASATVQYTQLTRNVATTASRTISGTRHTELRKNTAVYKRASNGKHLETRIPQPRSASKIVAKWTKARQYATLVKKTMATRKGTHAEVDSDIDEDDGTVIDNNPDLLNDASFDETIDPYQQSSTRSQLTRWEQLVDTIRQGGQVAICPPKQPTIARRRPRLPKPLPASKIPRMSKFKVKPLVPNPSPTLRSAPVTLGEQTKRSRPIWGQPSSKIVTGVVAKAKKQHKAKPHQRSIIHSKDKKLEVAKPSFLLSVTSKGTAQARKGKVNTSTTSKFKEIDPQSNIVMAVVDKIKEPDTVVPASVPASAPKVVRFLEGSAQPVLFDFEAPASTIKSPLDMDAGWVPLKLGRGYSSNSQAVGFETLFEPSRLRKDITTLKRRVLHRFKSVQDYEKRLKQEALAKGEQAPLGQLEYGSADYKISLQCAEVITAHDIGMYQEPGELGIPMSTYHSSCGPLLHFGGFQDRCGLTFKEASVPDKAIKPDKKPINRWPKFSSLAAMERWIDKKFSRFQRADEWVDVAN